MLGIADSYRPAVFSNPRKEIDMKVHEMRNRALTIGLAVMLLAILTYSPRATTASKTSPVAITAQNAELDFDLVNATGYDIKELYIGPSGTGDWDKSDEILKGKVLKDGELWKIKFHPKATAEKWDMMVTWADGSGKVEWLNLKLTEIDKITLKYNKATDKTTAVIN
jgi:hypothetical protein